MWALRECSHLYVVWLAFCSGSVSIGQVTSCRIAKVLPGDALLVELPGIKNYARCCLTDISDCYEEDPLKGYANKIAR